MASPPVVFAAGFLLGISLAAPPGPVLAIMGTASARGRVGESLATAAGAITGDAVWLLLVTAGFVAFLSDQPRALGLLGLGGAALLLWMAFGAWRAARAGLGESERTGSYKLGMLTVLTSPFSFAWWISNGPLLLAELGTLGIVGLFLAIATFATAFSYGMMWLGRRFARTATYVAYASAVLLGAFAALVAWTSLGYLR